MDWAPAAERDVDEIWDYIAESASPDIAERLIHEIFSAVARVAAHPRQGRIRGELRPHLRSVRAAPYLVFYRTGEEREERIEIVRVLHERRDAEVALAEEE